MNIYVGNLNYRVDETSLKSLFEQYGTVESVKIITDNFSGRSKGFAFVTMENSEEAKKAIQSLNETTFQDREMVVNEARERKSRY